MSIAVVLEGVTFSYPDVPAPALRDVSVAIPEGAFVLAAGATGAGKSTLLRTINGLVPHFSGGTFAGRVVTGGRDTRAHAPRELADLVAFVPQDPGASFVLDRVEDELAYGLENLGASVTTMRRRVEETLDLLAIEPLRDRSVRTLSGGERQRVAIAAALAAGPRILVLDEPTSQLDPQGAEDVLAALARLVHDLGLTVVVAEHRLERVAGFADVALGCLDRSVIAGAPDAVLEALGLGPPVTRLGRLLGWHPAPLTVRAARRLAADIDVSPPQPPPPRRGEPLVTATALRAGYGDRPVLAGVEIEIRSGDLIALMGRNGSGKTTLLKCLAGLHRPAGGTVAFEGNSPSRGPRPGIDVALCPQEPETVLFKDRVADEVAATLTAAGRPHSDAPHYLARLGLEDLATHHPRDLSAGARLLVAVAAVAATGAPVLLLDEPTRGLDPGSKRALGDFLRAHAAGGGAAVFATHDVELVAEIADRVVILASREVIAAGPPADVLGDSPVFAPQMARVFGAGWLTPEQVAVAVAEPADV